MPSQDIPEGSIQTADDFRQRYQSIRLRVDRACQDVGRNPDEVRILPVSKTVDLRLLRLAYEAGCREFGENKVQEARVKAEALSALDIEWSIIGHLQTNKVKYVAKFAHEFQALDNLGVAELLDRRLQAEGRRMDVLVQVNSSGESSKYGLPPTEMASFLKKLAPYTSLRIRGLMTIAVFSKDSEQVRQCFTIMSDLREQLLRDGNDPMSLAELSMGMSDDFEDAIAHGATIIRIGRALFGPRPTSDDYYWPAGQS